MSLLRRREQIEEWSLNKKRQKLSNRIGMINSILHGITENIDIRKPHKHYAGVQTEINRFEERKAKLETEKAGLQKQLKEIEHMLEYYS